MIWVLMIVISLVMIVIMVSIVISVVMLCGSWVDLSRLIIGFMRVISSMVISIGVMSMMNRVSSFSRKYVDVLMMSRCYV